MSGHDEPSNPSDKPKVTKLEAVKLKNDKTQKIIDPSSHDEDHDLTRELLDLYGIPFRRRKAEER